MVALALLAWPREREPEYKGRKLSKWIQDGAMATTSLLSTPPYVLSPKLQPADRAAKIEAIQNIGTNALPYLLKWIEAGELPKYGKLDVPPTKVMTRAAAHSWLKYRQRTFWRAIDAGWALEVLGSDAISTVPELLRLSHSTNQFAAGVAWRALINMENDATPELRDYIGSAMNPRPRDYTNSPGTTAATLPRSFAVGHVWRTNSKVSVPQEKQTPSTNIQHPDKLQ